MANSVTKRFILDGPKNTIIQVNGRLDTSDVSATALLTLAECSGQNSNVRNRFTGHRIDKVEFIIQDGLSVQLYWNATADQLIGNFYGRGDTKERYFAGIPPVNSGAAGYDGTLDIATAGYTSGAVYFTLLLIMKKLYAP